MMMMKTMMSGDNDENHQYQIWLFQRQWQEYLRSSNLRRPFTPWELYAAKILVDDDYERNDDGSNDVKGGEEEDGDKRIRVGFILPSLHT
ncbi:hypothetical protein QVD17_37950 [Tagetes erecta]|uniref:Uncharacterized protein n=1 Tax=Tagetes erecta TaxID=13708 RepID=A0AAD8JZA7_TARER|nr:hypothetical protein QVD17_37950 [Tagetes erecta]